MSAAIIGATGLVGKLLLPELLGSKHYDRVGEYGRRATTPAPSPSEKLLQQQVDFENLESARLEDEKWDVVYITLGTSKAIAGSKDAFTKIDKDYVVNFAKGARVAGKYQRLVYLLSFGANVSSYMFYPRSKGLTERELSEIGYDEFIVLRPAKFNNPDRSGTNREGETLPWIVSILGYFIPSINVPDISKVMRLAGEVGSAGLPKDAEAVEYHATAQARAFTVIENAGIIAAAKLTTT